MGYDYFSTLEIDLEEGREFSRDFASDSMAIVLHEAVIREMAIEDPLGMELRLLTSDTSHISQRVIGISSNYNFRSLHTDIELQITICNSGPSYVALMKIDLQEFENIEKILQEHWDNYETPA